MIIVLSWFDVIVKITRVFSEDNFWSERKIRSLLLVLVSISLIGSLGLALTKQANSLSISFIIMSIGNIIVYSIGFVYFTRKIESLGSKSASEKVSKGISLIKKGLQVNVFCSLLILLSAILFGSFFNVYVESAKPGDFNYLLLIVDIGVISLLIGISFTFWYSKQITFNLFARDLIEEKLI